jgi:hypothetical protein
LSLVYIRRCFHIERNKLREKCGERKAKMYQMFVKPWSKNTCILCDAAGSAWKARTEELFWNLEDNANLTTSRTFGH